MLASPRSREGLQPKSHALVLSQLTRDDLEALAVFKLWAEVGVQGAMAEGLVARMSEPELVGLLVSPHHSVGTEFMDGALLERAHAFRGRTRILAPASPA